MIDYIKIALALLLYFGIAPVYGLICSRRPKLIRFNLLLTTFCTSMPVYRWTYQVSSIEWYRGHTRGFEVNILVALALSSLLGMALSREYRVKFWAPSMGIWCLYIVAATLSVVNALEPSFVAMATLKFGFMSFICIAAFNSIKNTGDIRSMQNTLAFVLILQAIICLKQKYVDGIYRAQGTFPHENNLGMYSYMTALFLLGPLLHVNNTLKRKFFLAWGYLSGVALAFMTISRASFAASILGSALVMTLSIVTRPGVKKMAMAVALFVPVIAGVLVVSDQIIARFGGPSAKLDGVGSFRRILQEQAQAMLADEPLGIGWNNYCLANSRPRGKYAYIFEDYMLEVNNYAITDAVARRIPMTENLYWLILGETGYAAFVLFVLFFVLVWWFAARNLLFYRTHELGACTLSLTVIFTLLMVHAYVERILADTSVLVIFLLFVAIAGRLHVWRKAIKRGDLSFESIAAPG